MSTFEGLLKGLDWILENLQEFAITNRFNFQTPNLKDKFAQLKPISELAIALSLMKRCSINHELIDVLAGWIWEQTRECKVITSLVLARNDFLPCCSLYASLHHFGYRAPHLDQVMTYLSCTDMAGALPLAPWSALALNYNLRLLDLAPISPFQPNSLYIAALPEPWIMSGEIAYAITHEIFYLTDFGFGRLPDSTIDEYLGIWLPYWSRVFENQKDFDLTGEFAMAWRCIRPRSQQVAQGLSSVLSAQTPAGYVEGPEGAGSIVYQKDDSKNRRVFLGRYHTTLVAIMACALEMRAQCFSSEASTFSR